MMLVDEDQLYAEFTKTKGGKDLAFVKKNGPPLKVMLVNDTFKVAIYKGSISPQDIIVKYKQRLGDSEWTAARTPKHIHWAVDLIIKMHMDPKKTEEFLEFLLDMWRDTERLANEEDRDELSFDKILNECSEKIEEFKDLAGKGEYSIKFLILLAKLLMIQEKTNREDAYMFKGVLSALKEGKDIFDIVQKASYRGQS